MGSTVLHYSSLTTRISNWCTVVLDVSSKDLTIIIIRYISSSELSKDYFLCRYNVRLSAKVATYYDYIAS